MPNSMLGKKMQFFEIPCIHHSFKATLKLAFDSNCNTFSFLRQCTKSINPFVTTDKRKEPHDPKLHVIL